MSETAINNERYYTIKQASDEFGIAYSTLAYACRSNKIPHRDINNRPMMAESDIKSYIEDKQKRITKTSVSELTIDDLAEEILKRIQDAYDRGRADGIKEAKQAMMQAFKETL